MEFKHDPFENVYEIGEELGRLVGPISFKIVQYLQVEFREMVMLSVFQKVVMFFR